MFYLEVLNGRNKMLYLFYVDSLSSFVERPIVDHFVCLGALGAYFSYIIHNYTVCIYNKLIFLVSKRKYTLKSVK